MPNSSSSTGLTIIAPAWGVRYRWLYTQALRNRIPGIRSAAVLEALTGAAVAAAELLTEGGVMSAAAAGFGFPTPPAGCMAAG